jgi:hypothetical protein
MGSVADVAVGSGSTVKLGKDVGVGEKMGAGEGIAV